MQDVIWCNQFNTNLLTRMLIDVPPDQWRKQLPGLPNNAAWQLGHLTYSRSNAAMLLGKPGPFSPVDLKPRFGTGSSPEAHSVGGADKEQMLENFKAAQQHIAEILPTVTADMLDVPNPNEGMRKMFPTVRDAIRVILMSHDALHIGQLSVWRRAIGLDRVLG